MRFKPKMVAVLGDSLSAGSTTNLRRCWTALLDSDKRISPRIAIANSAKSGDTFELMATRYQASLQGQGFDCYILQGGINNMNVEDQDGPTAFAAIEPTIDAMLAEGAKVILANESPYSGAAVWNPTRQANYLALRALMLAKAGVEHVDWYLPFPAGMGDPANPTAIYPAFNWGDGEHWGDAAQPYVADIYARKLQKVLQATALELDLVGLRGNAMVFNTFPQLKATQIYALMPGAAQPELVHDGVGFQPGYINTGSSRTAYSLGWQFYVVRDGGWPAGAVISAFGP